MKRKLKSVLLIDDDEDDNYFHRLVIEEAEITEKIHIAESGLEALELLINDAIQPELIFLDINMPKINGWEFLEEFKKIDMSFRPVIILLSTSMSASDKKRAHEILKNDFFVTKPLTQEKIRVILTDYFSF